MLDLDDHLALLASGDADAFGRWLAGAEPRLRGSLRSYAARLDTEALVQEVLLRVWQVAPRHLPDGRPNSLLRLAIRIARNLAIDEIRRVRSEPILDDEGRIEAFEAAQRLRVVEAALDPEGLSTTARAVLARIRAAGG